MRAATPDGYFCCGNQCPGLTYKPCEQTPHPEACLTPGQVSEARSQPCTPAAYAAQLAQVALTIGDLVDAAEDALPMHMRERDETLARLTRERLANIAQTAERDIDAGAITFTGEDADRELARKAEVKHERAELSGRCIHVELPAGFVPEHVYTNRTTKAVTFNGGELKRTLQHSGARGVSHGGRSRVTSVLFSDRARARSWRRQETAAPLVRLAQRG